MRRQPSRKQADSRREQMGATVRETKFSCRFWLREKISASWKQKKQCFNTVTNKCEQGPSHGALELLIDMVSLMTSGLERDTVEVKWFR